MWPKKYNLLHDILSLYTLILVVWGFYRLLFRFPEWVEELLLKPLVFVAPVGYRLWRERGKSWGEKLASVGVTKKNWGVAVILGLALGAFYLLMSRIGAGAQSGAGETAGVGLTVVLAIATAMAEQLVFMGYILLRLNEFLKNEWWAVVVTAVMFAFIHMPILVFGYRLPTNVIASQFLLVFLLALGNGVVMLRIRNLIAPVISHVLWGLAVLAWG